jgi:rod shape determining protein RodA
MRQFFLTLRRADGWMFFAALILILLGFSALYSITLSENDQGFLLLEKQATALVVGLFLAAFILWSNYRWARSFALPLYLLSCLSLLAVLFFGETIRGTTGWFSFFDFHFQPVELAKIGVLVILARYFADYCHGRLSWKNILFSASFVAGPVVLTLMQPDLGSALLFLGLWIFVLFFTGLRVRQAAIIFFLAVLALTIAWFFLFADFQKARLISFVNPSSDPMGEGYNVRQAIIGVGSGNFFGRGLGFGSQSQLRFMPESQTDFIFAVIAEEFGFVGVLLLLGAYYLFLRRVFFRASRSRDDFTSFLLVGIGSLFFISFLVNVGMNLGLLPVTGIALPLVSYGGSALVVSLVLIGLAESATVHDVTVKGGKGIEGREREGKGLTTTV